MERNNIVWQKQLCKSYSNISTKIQKNYKIIKKDKKTKKSKKTKIFLCMIFKVSERNIINMERLIIKRREDNLWDILCNSEQQTILSFLWDRFIKSADEGNINYNNEEKIKKLVHEETNIIREENRKMNELIKGKDKNQSMSDIKLVVMQEQIDVMRDNKLADIDNVRKECNEGTNSFINCLQEQIITYKEKEKELEKDNTKLLSALIEKTSSSSYEKGVEGEDILLDILQESGEFKVEDTHMDNHKGDAVIRRNNKTYCIDSKNHKRNVPSEDVTKLTQDIELNNYDGGAIIAWNAPIYDPVAKAKIKNQICYKMISSKPILFVSRAKDISHEALISLLINLEDHIISNKSMDTSDNYDKLKEKMIKIAKSELKKVESVHNSLQRQLGNNKKERHYWNEVLKDFNKEVDTDSDNESNENITNIHDLITEISTKSKEQRNSSKDIMNYLIEYSKYHNHPLLNQCESLKKDELNDILLKLNFTKGNIRGKNYNGNIRDKVSQSWGICLPNICDNDTLN